MFEIEINFCCILFCQPTKCTVVQREHREQDAESPRSTCDSRGGEEDFKIRPRAASNLRLLRHSLPDGDGCRFHLQRRLLFRRLDAFLGLGPVRTARAPSFPCALQVGRSHLAASVIAGESFFPFFFLRSTFWILVAECCCSALCSSSWWFVGLILAWLAAALQIWFALRSSAISPKVFQIPFHPTFISSRPSSWCRFSFFLESAY